VLKSLSKCALDSVGVGVGAYDTTEHWSIPAPGDTFWGEGKSKGKTIISDANFATT
jgi:hypothetical protein